MLQKEMVTRLTAEPNSKHWGRLSVMVQYHCKTEYLFTVPPHAFSPAPKVDSAIIRLMPRIEKEFIAEDYTLFANLVNQAFTQRRKAIRNSIKPFLSAESIDAAGIDPNLRPDALSVAQYVTLANIAYTQSSQQ